jgi:hypothetical protein
MALTFSNSVLRSLILNKTYNLLLFVFEELALVGLVILTNVTIHTLESLNLTIEGHNLLLERPDSSLSIPLLPLQCLIPILELPSLPLHIANLAGEIASLLDPPLEPLILISKLLYLELEVSQFGRQLHHFA